MHKTLVYIGSDYDPHFPWGGYHITITGRNLHPATDILTFLQSSSCNTEMFTPSSQEQGKIGWILTWDKVKAIQYDASVDSILVYIQCTQLDQFHDSLVHANANDVIRPPLTGLKQNWHITMHSKDLEAVKLQVQRWIEDRKVFHLYAIDWDSETERTIWYPVVKKE